MLRSRSLGASQLHPSADSRAAAAWTWAWPRAPHALLLHGHTGCVNSIALSPAASTFSRLLVTGSDDQHLRLWPVYDLFDLPPASPPQSIATLSGARRNVFHALFASPHLLVSSGADGILRAHDLNHTSGPPSLTFANEHGDIVQRLATLCEQVVMSASDDGSVRVWDARDARKSVGVLQLTVPVSHVEAMGDQQGEFLCCGEGGLLAKFDFRTCFGGSKKRKRRGDEDERVDRTAVAGSSAMSRRNRRWRVLRDDGPEPVLEYGIDHDNIASLAPSPSGQHFVALPQYGLPHLFSTTHSTAQATFSHSTSPPDATDPDAFHFTGYSNVATHKVPAFLPSGTHFISGSDDFGIYAWRVPRHTLSPADSHSAALPEAVTHADQVLFGHMSLPNRILPHPDLPMLFSCGVEHSVRVSTFAPGSDPPASEAKGPRRLMSTRLCMDAFRDVMQGIGEGEEEDGERAERRTVAYFDMIVRQAAAAQARREAQGDASSSTSSSSESESEPECDSQAEGEAGWMDVMETSSSDSEHDAEAD